jgi:hypothetical protein
MNETLKDADSAEATRLEMDKERLRLEQWRVKQEQRFSNKYLAIILTSAISVAGLIVGYSNIKVAQMSKEKELEITRQHHEKDLDLELTKLLSQNSEKINGNEDQRNLLRAMIITAFSDKANKIFEALSNAATGDNRKYWRGQSNLFAGVTAKDTQSPLFTGVTKGDTPSNLVAGVKNNNLSNIPPSNIENIASETKKVADIQKIEPKVKESVLGNIRGTEIYNFSLWLDIPKDKKGKIKEVSYTFNHPSFRTHKRRSSSNESTGFSISYEGWGAIDDVAIEILYKDGNADKMHLNMIKALGRE